MMDIAQTTILDKYFKPKIPSITEETSTKNISEIDIVKNYENEKETEMLELSFEEFLQSEVSNKASETKPDASLDKKHEKRKTKRKRQSDEVKTVKKAKCNTEVLEISLNVSDQSDDNILNQEDVSKTNCVIVKTAKTISFDEFVDEQKITNTNSVNKVHRKLNRRKNECGQNAKSWDSLFDVKNGKTRTLVDKTHGKRRKQKSAQDEHFKCKNSSVKERKNKSTVSQKLKNEKEQNEKRRKSSSDGVVYVAEVKKATHPHLIPEICRSPMKPKKPVIDLPPLKNDCILWTEKYEPVSSEEVTGNASSVKKLLLWLLEWKKKVEKEQKQLLKESAKAAKSKTKKDDNSSGSDFEGNSDEDWVEEDDSLASTAVVIGPTGSGKTAAVYACAKELDFKVFEMNASSQRSSKQVLSQLQEATQSHQVSKNQQIKSSDGNAFFQPKGKPESLSRKSLPNVFAQFPKKKNIKEEQKFKDSSSNPLSNMNGVSKARHTSLILFEEVEVLFEDDKFFWSAIQTIMLETKRPIILTTTDSSVLNNLEGKYEKFLFKHPTEEQLSVCLRNIGNAENFQIPEKQSQDLKLCTRVLGCDIRKSINAVHFWGCNAQTCDGQVQSNELDDSVICLSSQTDTDVEEKTVRRKTKKGQKRGRRKINPEKKKSRQSLTEKEETNHVKYSEPPKDLHRIFDCVCGTNEVIINALKNIKPDFQDQQDLFEASQLKLLQRLSSEPGNPLIQKLVEGITSHMYFFNLPQLILINWQNLIPHKTSDPLNTVGKNRLPIHLPQSYLHAPSADMEFSSCGFSNDYMTMVEGVSESSPQVPADFLIEEDSMDVCYANVRNINNGCELADSQKSLLQNVARSHNSANAKTTSSSEPHTKKSLFMTLNQLSIMSDACSLSDHLHSSYFHHAHLHENFKEDLDQTVCKIRDGLLDRAGTQLELNYHTRAITADIQASIQTMSLTNCIRVIQENSTVDLYSTLGIADDVLLKLPHENKTRKYGQYLRQSMQSMLVGGNFTPQKAFVLDYMPALRSICRAEERRKEAKAKRRFLHYLNNIQLHPKNSELFRLQNDFEEKPEQN